jgi:hypothetical protein
MALRPRRQNVVIWSSSGVPDTGSWAWRPARPRRIRWWLRTGTMLALIGLVRLARTTRTRWEPVSLVAGAALMVIGFELPAASVAFLLGIGVLVVTLLRAIATKGRGAGQAADCWQWRG